MKFIGTQELTGNAVYFRKTFKVRAGVESVKISASALGVFKGYVNGQEMANDRLSPGWTNYHIRIPYYTYDVTDKISVGKNCLGFILGNGWAVGKIGWFGKNFYSNRPLLWCLVTIRYEDGTEEEFGSDKSFYYTYGAIRENDILDGENIDANQDLGDFSFSTYLATSWQSAVEYAGYADKLEKATAPLTVPRECFEGQFLYNQNGYAVYDFSQNHAGVVEIAFKNTVKDTKITVIYGEMLDTDGSVYTENLRTAKCTDTYICRGEKDYFAPLFTFHGYRYCGIKIEGQAEIKRVQSIALYSDIKFHGEFACSDNNVNKLFQNICWGQKSNFLNLPTDCPQRDERLGWTGDAQVFCKTAMYNSDVRDFYRKYLKDVRDTQREDGMIDCIAPSVVRDFDKVNGAPAWSDAIAIIPYEYYCVYKDDTIIQENIISAKRWVDYCVNTSNNYIRVLNWVYGDWLSLNDDMDYSVIGTLFMANSAELVSRMCKIIGDPEAEKYAKIYKKIKQAFLEKFVDEDDRIISDTQTCYLLAYQFGILPKERVHDNLLRTIRRKNNHLSTGFIGVRFLLPTLCDLGESALAYELLTKTDYPSWCYSVVNGATTVWERWNSYEIGKGFADRRMNSFNHYSLGSVGEWLYAYALGIQYTEEGIVLRPNIDKSGQITWVKGGCQTYAGKIYVEWKTEGNKAHLCVKKPDNVMLVLSDYKEVCTDEKNGYVITL